MKQAFKSALILAILMGSTALTQATEEQAKEAARQVREQLKGLGFQVRNTYLIGVLDKGESTVFTRTFYQDNEYVLVATGSGGAQDMDVYIFDEDGSLVSQDSKVSPTAVTTFKAEYTGKYFVKVVMYDASGKGTYYAFQYGYR